MTLQMGCICLWADTQSIERGTADEVRVMSWNILYKGWEKEGHAKWQERIPGVIEIIREHKPDVVGLQEESKQQAAAITGGLSGYSYLGAHQKKGGGLLIRTDAWRVIESGRIAIPGKRQASWALLESTRNGARWLFYNAHLIHRTAPGSAAQRMEGAKSIVDHIVRHAPAGVPVVFVGDFNALNDMPVMRYLAGEAGSPLKFSNAFAMIHGADDPRGTYRGLSKEQHCDRIDHILVNDHTKVTDAEIIFYDQLAGAWPSDHYPVHVTLSTAQVQDAGQTEEPSKKEAYPDSVPPPTHREVRYGEHQRHVLDFWKAEADQPTPLVFVIHGGGWKGGSKERLNRFVDAAALLKAGISVVAINYRYTKNNSELKPPVKAPLYDSARALQFVRSKAAEWNIDKTRIAAAGSSAGACSSLWLLYHDDLADPESEDPIARESTRLYCAAVNNAQTTLDPQQMKEWTPNSKYGGHAFGINDFDQFLAEREKILPWIAEYSPYALVSAEDPPVYLYYKGAAPDIGKPQKDPTHTANFGLKLQEHCVKLGVKCELVYRGAPNIRYKTATDYLIAEL